MKKRIHEDMLGFWVSFHLKCSVPWICKAISKMLNCEDIFDNVYNPSLLEKYVF